MRRVDFLTRRPTGDDDAMEPWETYMAIPTLTVFEPEAPDKAGVLDADGNPLVRERNPIGFLADL